MSKHEKLSIPFEVTVANIENEEADDHLKAKLTLVLTDSEWPRAIPRLQNTIEYKQPIGKFHEVELPEETIKREFKSLLFKFAAIGLMTEMVKRREEQSKVIQLAKGNPQTTMDVLTGLARQFVERKKLELTESQREINDAITEEISSDRND